MMKVYYLYLSTRTGATTQVSLTGIAAGPNRYATSVIPETMKPNQYITIDGVINSQF